MKRDMNFRSEQTAFTGSGITPWIAGQLRKKVKQALVPLVRYIDTRKIGKAIIGFLNSLPCRRAYTDGVAVGLIAHATTSIACCFVRSIFFVISVRKSSSSIPLSPA